MDEWKLRAQSRDNHWLDCLVACAVAASMSGAVLFGTDRRPVPRRKVRMSEVQKAAKVWRAGEGGSRGRDVARGLQLALKTAPLRTRRGLG